MEYTIKKAEPNDLTELTSLSRKTINEFFRPFMGDEAVDMFIDSGMADKEITDNLNETSILLNGGQIIGFCIWKENLLHLMMIDSDFHGTGAAQYFLDFMCAEKFRLYSELHLECFENNKRALSFYEKCGWSEYHTETDSDTGWKRIFYKKSRSNN